MKVTYLLVIAYFVVVAIGLLNHFHRKNVQYELEYKQGKRPRWQ